MIKTTFFCAADNDILILTFCLIDLEWGITNLFIQPDHSLFQGQTLLKADIWQQCTIIDIFVEQQYE